MTRLLSLILISLLIFPFADIYAATKYVSGKKGGCYTVMKSKKTGKNYKKYVDVKYCKKTRK